MPNAPLQLSRIDLLADLDPAALAEVEQLLHFRSYTAEQIVLTYQDPTRDVFFLLRGHLRVTIFDADGREVSFRDLDAGDSFGELSAIDGQPRSASVVALTDAQVAVLGARDFSALLRRHPPMMEATLLKLTKLIRSLSERVTEFNRPVPVRVACELQRLAKAAMINERTARLVPPPKHADMASRINTHREAVSRTMSALTKLGILRRGQRELLVTDVDRLAEWAAAHRE